MTLRLTLVIAAALALSGCGGGKTYSADATRSCLTAKGATVDPAGADAIAQSASGGGFEVTIGGKILNLSFGKDSGDAKALLSQYETVGFTAPAYRKGNAVLVGDDEPGADQQTVDGCLS